MQKKGRYRLTPCAPGATPPKDHARFVTDEGEFFIPKTQAGQLVVQWKAFWFGDGTLHIRARWHVADRGYLYFE